MNGEMQDFTKAEFVLPTRTEYIAQHLAHARSKGATEPDANLRHEAMARYEHYQRVKVVHNDQYQVVIDNRPEHGFPNMLIYHLAIRRIGGGEIHDWADLQAIKNKLCGEDVEAIELYPNMARTIPSDGQYHLWAFIGQRGNVAGKGGGRPLLPIGFTPKDNLEPPIREKE